VARRFYPVGSGRAKAHGAHVTADVGEAVRAVEAGMPVVLVGEDAAALGEAISSAPDRGRRERLLAVVVGDPADPAVVLAAEEMAGELWQWVKVAGEPSADPGDLGAAE
jgi:hypothetical protein